MKRVLTSILFILLAIGAIVFAFFIPYFVFKYEDRRTSNYDIHYAAEKLNLENYEISLYEKLEDLPIYLNESSYIYIFDNDNKSNISSNLSMKEAKEKVVDDMCDVFLGERLTRKLSSFNDGILRVGGLKKYLKNSQDLSIYPSYIIRTDKNDMYLVWVIDCYIEELGNFSAILDDETGKILSIQTFYYDMNLVEQFNYYFSEDSFKKRLESYYNLTLKKDSSKERNGYIITDMSFNNPSASETGDELTLQMLFEGDKEYTYSFLFNYIDADDYIYVPEENPDEQY
ncbi:MAG: hypothetical protein J5517_03420 [Eubacterium sp.]|nr:hypothetical protein [Eubacterium sp.]